MKSTLKHALLSFTLISVFYPSTSNAAADHAIAEDAMRGRVADAFTSIINGHAELLKEYLVNDQPMKFWNNLLKPALAAQGIANGLFNATTWNRLNPQVLPKFYFYSSNNADDNPTEQKAFYLYDALGNVVYIERYTVTMRNDGGYNIEQNVPLTQTTQIQARLRRTFDHTYRFTNPLRLLKLGYIERANRRKWAIGAGATAAVIGADIALGLAKKFDVLHWPVTALAYARYGIGKVVGFGINNTLGHLPYVGGLVTKTTNWYGNFTNNVWFGASAIPSLPLPAPLTLDDAVKMVANAGQEGIEKCTTAGVKLAAAAVEPIAKQATPAIIEAGFRLLTK